MRYRLTRKKDMKTSTIKNETKHFYAHYCLDCQMMYFGRELNVVKPCIRCGSKNVLNGPLIASKEKTANVAENNN